MTYLWQTENILCLDLRVIGAKSIPLNALHYAYILLNSKFSSYISQGGYESFLHSLNQSKKLKKSTWLQ